jgi:hypothetical protein
MDLQLLEALEYAKRGWAVTIDHGITSDGKCTCHDLLCKTPGKHPRIEREEADAYLRREGTIDPNLISEWWARWPESNVAICCGKNSNLVVVDVDARSDGFTSLAELESQIGPLQNTLACLTGGSGLHLYFSHPQYCEVRNRIGLFPGIDIKADGGRIVAPPSRHASGKSYAWASSHLHTAIAPLPNDLLEMIQHQKGTGTRFAMKKRTAVRFTEQEEEISAPTSVFDSKSKAWGWNGEGF